MSKIFRGLIKINNEFSLIIKILIKILNWRYFRVYFQALVSVIQIYSYYFWTNCIPISSVVPARETFPILSFLPLLTSSEFEFLKNFVYDCDQKGCSDMYTKLWLFWSEILSNLCINLLIPQLFFESLWKTAKKWQKVDCDISYLIFIFILIVVWTIYWVLRIHNHKTNIKYFLGNQ